MYNDIKMTKKIFPKIKQKLKGFLTNESWKITKKDALWISAAVVLWSAIEDTFAAHSSHTNVSWWSGWWSGHSSFAHSNTLSCGVSTHASSPGHASGLWTESTWESSIPENNYTAWNISWHGSVTWHSSHWSHSNNFDPNGCFTYSQRVLTPQWYRPIWSMSIWDEVISYNHEKNTYGTSIIKYHIIHDWVNVFFNNYKQDYLAKIFIETETWETITIETTENHPFYDVITKTYKQIRTFSLWDKMFIYKKTWILKKVEIIITGEHGEDKDLPIVYNLHMEEKHNHNYFIEWCLVHNADDDQITMNP